MTCSPRYDAQYRGYRVIIFDPLGWRGFYPPSIFSVTANRHPSPERGERAASFLGADEETLVVVLLLQARASALLRAYLLMRIESVITEGVVTVRFHSVSLSPIGCNLTWPQKVIIFRINDWACTTLPSRLPVQPRGCTPICFRPGLFKAFPSLGP